jgi:polyphosphate kinase 2 (PPK2 family)
MLPERVHSITEAQADELTARFAAMETNEPAEYQFHNDQVQDLVNQTGAAIFCVQPGVDANGKRVLILTVKDETEKMVGATRLELSFP